MSSNVSKLEELKKRVLFTVLMLGIYRVATQVPTPGVDGAALSSFFDGMKGSLFSVFNTFSGGALERFSVLALGIMPYITSSIIFSLLSYSIPALGELQKEPDGHKKISQYTRYATVLLCFFQGYGLAVGLENIKSPNGLPVVIDPGMSFRLLTVISLTAGTMFVMWLGEQITERGIGNGISLIIFAGIAAGIPRGIRDTFQLLQNGEMTFVNLIIVLAIMLVLLIRLDCFFNYVNTFNNNTISLEIDGFDFALLAFVFAREDLNGVVHFQLLHFFLLTR
jgi:preprotein translocase subunit SecY